MKIINKDQLKAGLLSFYPLIPLLILIDQVTKALAKALGNREISLINWKYFGFSLIFRENQGAAWSMFSGHMEILAVISLIAAIAMLAYRIYARNKLSNLSKATWAVLIAGTVGNLIDRTFFKNGVIDFLSFRFGESYYFPTFNFADMCLVIGTMALLILITFNRDIKNPSNPITVTKTQEDHPECNEEELNHSHDDEKQNSPSDEP